ERVVIAQRLDPTSLQPAWRVELVQLGQEVKPDDVARREGGTKDQVRGLPVVVSPRGSFFVFFSPRVVAEACPADRQKLGRGLRLDLAGPAAGLKPFANEFVLEVMEAMGAAVDDLGSWQAKVEGKAVVMSGALTEQGARLLLSPAANRITGPAYQDPQRLETT